MHLYEADAWRMLSELERGYQPTIVYQDWIDGRDRVSVSLSVVRFQESYRKFLHCASELLPFTFEDIRQLVLPFDFDSARFTREAKQKMNQLVTYLKADPDVELVLLMGHTDSRGRRAYNKALSQKRAEAVKRYLIEHGIAKGKISVRAFGETAPVASNAHAPGRAKNRRVVVRLYRE
jgi:outer membrane protein OmpA-like peptidoglycan-associated protein